MNKNNTSELKQIWKNTKSATETKKFVQMQSDVLLVQEAAYSAEMNLEHHTTLK